MDRNLLEAVENGGVVADGSMGGSLYERGVYVNRNFDEINLEQSQLVFQIHRDYLLAGAHLLETNTYGANRMRLARHGLGDKTAEINRRGVETALRAADGAAWVIGSIGPTGLNPSHLRRSESEVAATFVEQATALKEAGVHAWIIETFSHPEELRIALRAIRPLSDIPLIAQFKAASDGRLIDGTSPLEFAKELRDWGADIIGVNCSGPAQIFDIATSMVESDIPVCAMPNAGSPETVEDRQMYLSTPENFGVFARRLYKAGVKIVGGCCGTNPEHIQRVSSAARMFSPKAPSSVVVVDEPARPQPSTPIEERTEFGKRLGKEFLFSVEVNPKAGIDPSSSIDAARMLQDAGADVINIADGPRATVRMSNLSLAVSIQRELNMETLLHVCCRDRNFLGLQSHLLGAHVLGVQNLVLITGDPPKMGDYPNATAVYDVDSIGLIGMVNGFNCGVDPAGKPMPHPTEFVIATGAEPAAIDFERELLRLRQKIDNGANLVMTQPIYDPAHMERFLEATADLDIPVMVGILPLASHKNAEFLHNHVPGMQIPDAIRARMKAAGKGESAREEGIKIAVEALEGLRNRVAGAYIMPPLGRYDMAAKIIEAFRDDRSIAAGVPGRRDYAASSSCCG